MSLFVYTLSDNAHDNNIVPSSSKLLSSNINSYMNFDLSSNKYLFNTSILLSFNWLLLKFKLIK